MSTTSYKVNGVDLSTIFSTYTTGTKASTTNYKVGGNDLCNIFQKYTSGSQASVTGIKVNGADLNTIFAPIVISSKTWSTIGTSGLSGTGAVCYRIFVNGSNIYVCGLFTGVGGLTTSNIARYNGTSWYALGSGLDTTANDLILTSNGDLWSVGDFLTSGSIQLNHIGVYSYSSATPVWSTRTAATGGSGGFPVQIGTTGNGVDRDASDRVFIGGNFNRAQGTSTLAGSLNYITGLYNDGGGFDFQTIPANAARNANGLNGICNVVKYNSVNSTVYFGGQFTGFYNKSTTLTTCNYICSYNTTTLNSLSKLGSGTNGAVYAIEVDPSGNVYVGGNFTTVNGTTISANYVAMWNGTTWSALGNGLNGQVNVLKYYNGILYAGGTFTKLGDNVTVTNYIAQYSGGTWSAINNSLNSTVETLNIDSSGKLIVGGSFTSPYIGLAVYG